jgi:hypothetical protein
VPDASTSPDPTPGATTLVKAVGQVAGGITGGAGLVLALGVAALTARVWILGGGSALGIVPQLPSDVLISYGVEVAAVPGAMALVYALTRAVTPNGPTPVREGTPPNESFNRPAKFVTGLAIVFPALVAVFFNAWKRGFSPLATIVSIVGVIVVGAVLFFAFSTLRKALVAAYNEAGEPDLANRTAAANAARARSWNSLNAVVVMSVLVFLVTLPGSAFVIASVPLQHVAVCTESGRTAKGYLIGESSDETYLISQQKSITSFAKSDVARTWVGKATTVWTDLETASERCPKPPAKS